MKANEPSSSMLAFLRETAPNQVRDEIPASEEELRFEAAWMEMVARKRQAAQAADEVVTEPFDLSSLQLYRRPARKPVLRRLAVAAVAAAVVVGLGYALRPHWRLLGPGSSPEVVEKKPAPSKEPGPRLVDMGKGETVKPLPSFEEEMAGLKKRLEAGMNEQEALLAYKDLLDKYPGHEAAIKGDRDLAFAMGLPDPPVVKNPGKAPESRPRPVVDDPSLEEIRTRIAAAGNPPSVRDAKVRELREQANRYRSDHPEPKIPEIEAFIAASELTPGNELRYAEARAKQLGNSPKDTPEVRELRGIILALRLRDESRPLVLPSKALAEFMKLTRLDDLAAKAVEMKAAVLALVDRFSTQKGRGPYLLCVLPPGIREESYLLYRDVQAYAMKSVDPPDAVFVDFLTRARRSLPGDTMGVIVPTYPPERFRIGTAAGDDNWDRLISAGNRGVPIAAVVNIVINREVLLKQNIDVLQREDAVFNTIINAKKAGITTLACLDCRPGVKSDASLTDEIDSWSRLYGNLDGYFIYGANNNLFKNIYNYIRNKHGLMPIIVYSVTQIPPEDQIKAALTDNQFVVCIEQEAMTVDQYEPPGWVAKYEPGRFAGVFRANQADLATSADRAAAKHLGYLYLTDNGPQIPGFLSDELASILQLNARIMGSGAVTNPAARKKKTANPKPK